MKFDRLYRASLYVTLFLASLLLSVDASHDNRFALAYPLGVAVASFLCFLTVDRDSKLGLPRDVANFLALLSFGLGLMEYLNDQNLLMLSIGHTLIYLQVIKYALPKTVEDDWYLFLLGLVQVVIGVHISQSDEVGILLFLWAIASIWTFGLFYLRREAIAGKVPAGVIVLPRPNRDEPYPGLLDLGFILATVRVAATTLLLGALIFFLMPRWSARGPSRTGKVTAAKHITGFSDSVKLGAMGEILENDSIVLSLEVSDENDQVQTSPPDMLLRGVTLTDYNNGQWDREETLTSDVQALQRPIRGGVREIRQRIKMEATDNDILFSLRPVLQVRASAASEVRLNSADGTIYRGDIRENPNEASPSRAGKFDYVAISNADASAPQRFEQIPSRGRRATLLSTSTLEEPLKAIVEPILAQISGDDPNSDLARVRALESYLRDGEFTYSLKMDAPPRGVDPVLHFLVTRKEGHCEYFASALTLMCRAAGIPARMVNGFKGGDWNELSRVTLVREKHAHSWVEAMVGTPNDTPRWVTLDPTPARQREEVVAQVGSGAFKFRFLSDSIRTLWTFNVVGFDSDRQERGIYGPIRQFAALLARGFRIIFGTLRALLSLLYFEDIQHFFSVRGFVVSTMAMLGLLGLGLAARRTWRWITGKGTAREGDAEGRDPGVAFYYRLVKILAAHGFVRPAAETPREFARRATEAMALKWPGGDLTPVPGMVVDAFYSKRFGNNELSPTILSELERCLESLELGLERRASGGSNPEADTLRL